MRQFVNVSVITLMFAAVATPQTVIDLPVNYSFGRALAINDRGDIIGDVASESFSEIAPFYLSHSGELIWLEDGLPEGVEVTPTGLNNRGEVVGDYAIGGQQFAFIWDERNGFREVPPPPECESISVTGVASGGTMVGLCSVSGSIAGAFILGKSGFTLLPFDPSTGEFVLPSDIANNGTIVGYTPLHPCCGSHAGYLIKNGSVSRIRYQGDPFLQNDLYGISNRGDVVGIAKPDEEEYPEPQSHVGFVLRAGAFYSLPQYVWPYDINSSGDIVGSVYLPALGVTKPFVWRNWKPE